MPTPLVADTTVFVCALHDRRRDLPMAIERGHLFVPAVVLAELYAGTRSAPEARLLDRLAQAAASTSRLLVPTADEWTLAGRLLARRSRLHGALRPRHHLADVLVVLTAARVGGTVLTANVQHLDAWARLARRAGMTVRVTAA